VPRVFVSIGSNIEREANIRAAVAMLRSRYGALELSPVYESAPVGFAGEPFYNVVVAFDTAESAEALAAALREMEAARGRKREANRFTSRTLDLDLIQFGDEIRSEPPVLPRAETTEYACILRPLSELAPALRHPVTGERYAVLWSRFDQSKQPLRRVEMDLSLHD
jgi:2-amino-4-hydroxy-6-hydroxymethyldihydropteridine diphosphokinase